MVKFENVGLRYGPGPEVLRDLSFRIDPEDFDLDFRRWLRKKYLPKLVETGEPSDFGRPFRDRSGDITSAISPVASPSGDLVAAFAITRGDLDIVLYDRNTRQPIANLTEGYTSDYQYLVSQFVTAGARMGRDLAFSSDGNYLAAFWIALAMSVLSAAAIFIAAPRKVRAVAGCIGR